MRRRIALIILIPLALGLLNGNTAANAQRASDPGAPGAGYDLAWHVIASGGGLSTGGSFALQSSIGQPAAGALSGGSYSIQGGFWGGAALALNNLYLPLARN